MRISALILVAAALVACSQSDNVRAREQADQLREQARQTAEKAKAVSEKALQEADKEAHKASRELDEDLDKVRRKTRHALDQPDDPGHR